MSERSETRIKAQRTSSGLFVGACLALSPDDLSFVDSGTEWLTVEKEKTKNGLVMIIRGAQEVGIG